MFRWTGNKDDSEKQAADRSSRAARRTIASLPIPVLSSDEEVEFNDCETSFAGAGIPNLDGNDDEPEMDAAQRAAAELQRQRALPIEDANYESHEDAWKKEVKLKFDLNDVKYTFNAVESQFKKFGINSQWDKKDALVSILPEAVIDECKPILRLSEAEAGPHIY